MRCQPRLLFFENNAAYFLSHRLPLAQAMHDRGYDVHVAAMPGPSAEAVSAAGFEFHPVKFSRGGVNPVKEWVVLRRIRRLYRELRPQLVYQVTVKPVIYGTMAARREHVAAVVSVISGLGYFAAQQGWRGGVFRRAGFSLYRFALRHPNQKVIFHNVANRDEFVARGILKPEDLDVLPGSGVDIDYFQPAPESQGTPLVVLPGRMLREKGVREFIGAARLLRDQGVRVRFLLAGKLDPANPSSMPEAELRRRCSESGVEWNGPVPDMRSLYAQSHVVCLPSYHEGMPRVLLEAAASGRAVVTTDVPGCRDAVIAGETALLVPPGEAGKLAVALRALIENPDMRQRMGARGRVLAEERFSSHQVVERTVEIMESLMSAKNTRAG